VVNGAAGILRTTEQRSVIDEYTDAVVLDRQLRWNLACGEAGGSESVFRVIPKLTPIYGIGGDQLHKIPQTPRNRAQHESLLLRSCNAEAANDQIDRTRWKRYASPIRQCKYRIA